MVLGFSEFYRVVPLSNREPLLRRYAPTAWPHGGGVYSAWKIHCRETVDDEYGVDLDEGQ